MKNINSCVSPEFKPSSKTCDKFEISECGAFSKAFELGYSNWCEPCNPYVIGSNDYVDYELGVKQAVDEQY